MVLRQLEYLSRPRPGAPLRPRRGGLPRHPAGALGGDPEAGGASWGSSSSTAAAATTTSRRRGASCCAGRTRSLASVDGLIAEAARLGGELGGRLRLGVIPTALPAIAETDRAAAEATTPASPRGPLALLERDRARSSSPSTSTPASPISTTSPSGGCAAAALRGALRLPHRRAVEAEELAWAALDGVALCLLTARDAEPADHRRRRCARAAPRRARASRATRSPPCSPSPAPGGRASSRRPGSASTAFPRGCAPCRWSNPRSTT